MTVDQFEVPTELWMQIMLHLPHGALLSTFSVSRLFYALSLPLLFQELRITPYGRNGLIPDPQRILDRLEFLSSDKIAPCIIEFVLDLRGMPPALAGAATTTAPTFSLVALDSQDELISATFRTILHFRKLRILSCAFDVFLGVDLSRLGLESLPTLDHLTIYSGWIYSPTTPPASKIKVKHVSFSASHLTQPRADDRRRSFLSAVDPQSLCSIAVDFPRFAKPDWLEDASDLLHTFCNLCTLSITSPFLARIQSHRSIARFPALRNLAITGSYMGVQAALAAPLCPSLHHFTGPCDLLPLVLLDTSCRRLTLLPCMPEELLKALEGVDPAPSITTLSLSLLHPQLRGWATPHGVFNRFAAVVDLRLHISPNVTSTEEEEYTQEALLEIFVAILRAPIALEKATISWHSEHRIMGMQYEFESALRSAVPGLRSLCLEANDRSVSLSRRPGREFR